MKPIIGLTILVDELKNSYWMLPGYMNVVEKAGGVPIILPLTSDVEALKQVLSLCDGIILTGGHDVSPSIYGETSLPTCGLPCDERDTAEAIILEYVIDNDIPMLGICRGLQFMNVYLGGTLYQHLPEQLHSTINHQMTSPYDRQQHMVTVLEDTPLYQLLKSKEIGVNSYHHQGVKELASVLKVAAYSTDELIEAAYHPQLKFFWGIQWHPEFSFESDSNSMAIMKYFIELSQM